MFVAGILMIHFVSFISIASLVLLQIIHYHVVLLVSDTLMQRALPLTPSSLVSALFPILAHHFELAQFLIF